MKWRASDSRYFEFAMQSRPSRRRKKADDRRCGTEIEAAVLPPVFGQTRSIEFVLGESVRQRRQPRHGNDRHPRLPVDKDVSAHAGQGLPLMLTVEPLPIGAALPPGIFVVRSHASRHSSRYGTYRHRHHFPYHQTEQSIFVAAPASMALVRSAGLPMPGVARCFPSDGHHQAPDMTGPSSAIGPSPFAALAPAHFVGHGVRVPSEVRPRPIGAAEFFASRP